MLKSGLSGAWPWMLAFVVVWALHFSVADTLNPYLFSIVMYAGINIILAVSLNLINGFTGQFSMGHAGFMSVGGYMAAFLSSNIRGMNPDLLATPFGEGSILIFCLLTGGILAGLVGYVVGQPSLRLRGDYLAIVTLGFGEIIRVVILNMNSIGGARGMPDIPALSTFGWVYTLVVVVVYCISRLVQAPHGREMLAVREDEIAAEAMGVNTTRAKVRAFVIGAFFAGVAGGLFAHYLRYLNPAVFDFNKSFEIIIMVVLGGMGSISGSVIAALLLTGLREALRPLQELTQIDFRMILYSLILIIMMLTRPNGLFGTKEISDFIPFLKGRREKERTANP
jgi:branched-chain amino acid transport system permease protein